MHSCRTEQCNEDWQELWFSAGRCRARSQCEQVLVKSIAGSIPRPKKKFSGSNIFPMRKTVTSFAWRITILRGAQNRISRL
jgi:hypothetical protein